MIVWLALQQSMIVGLFLEQVMCYMAELIAIYDCMNDRSGGRGCKVGSYKEL